MPSKELYATLDAEVQARDWKNEQGEIDEMTRLYEGELPQRYKKFFPQSVPEHLVQVIPLAWDDLATQAGRLPDLRGEPRNRSQAELAAVGKLEKIGFYYLRCSKPTGKQFMKQLAWWLQLGRAVAIVTPDFDKQVPTFQLRDPRTCYPGVKQMVNNTIVELSDLTFKYEVAFDEAVKRGLADPHKDERSAPPDKITVIEYIDDKQWVIVSEQGKGSYAEHGLGMVPGHVFESYTPNKKAGKNRFRDQVTLAVAISRLITAKLAFADRLIHPILWSRGHEGVIEVGPYTVNKLGPQGEIGQISPPTQLQVDSDIQMLNQFSRILNRNPEVRQGEVQARGQYVSAKTLEQLADSIDTVVGSDWDVIGPGMEYLFRAAFTMDVLLWPDVEKTITGDMAGKKYLESYIPSKDIADRRNIRVDYGFGVGGYQGFLMHLQAGDAGYMSKRRVIESMPGIHDAAEEMNIMDIEAMDEAGKAMFQTLAAQGALDMRIWSKIRKEMAEKGLTLHEAIIRYDEELAKQAQAAMSQEGDMGALTAPTPEEMAPPEEELAGVPPAVLAGI